MRLVAGVCLLWTGCFYIDPINEKPKAGVVCKLMDSEEACPEYVHRGDQLALEVRVDDPDAGPDEIAYEWTALLCADANGNDCKTSYGVGQSREMALKVPATSSDMHAIKVTFDVRDGRGAQASAFQIYKINDAPTLALDKSARSYVSGAPISLFAMYGDPDQGPGDVTLTWDVVAPPGKDPPMLEDLEVSNDGSDPVNRTVGKLLVPNAAGPWTLIVTATDSRFEVTEARLPVLVGPDQPPCLVRAQPVVAPEGVSLPIAEPTLFQVLLVDDDLDPYPSLSDPHFGTTTFEWSILPPGASQRQPLVGAGNAVELNPRAFTPGEIVELRVEIFDHIHTEIPCPDDVAVCSVTSKPGCVQRQTWRVEVR